MNMRKILILGSLILISQLLSADYYAVLPVYSIGIDAYTTQTVNMLLRQNIAKETGKEIISQSRTDAAAGGKFCMDAECALEIGQELNAIKVVSSSLSKLGKKIVVQFMLFDVENNRTILTDNVVSENIDDLEMVIKRISISIARETPIEKSAEVGAIVKNEEKSLTRRQAKRFAGFSFGYLFPTEGYDGNTEESFTADFRTGYEITNTAVGALFAIRKGFATNIYISYLMTRKDICPYLGGALGFHWVNHKSGNRSDGFELTASSGLRLFRTYNFQVIINLDYIYTFNDFKDQALVFTVGLLK